MNRDLQDKKILIVEDAHEASRFMKIFLEMAGATVDCVEEPGKALSQINNSESEIYDIILSDINMPGMSGYEFLKEVRKNTNFDNTPIIAISGDSNDDSKSEQCGFHSHLIKPVDPEKLVSHLSYLQ